MAAPALDVSAVVSFALAARKLSASGRFISASEKWARAVEAARTLGAPDCLIVADAQVGQAWVLLSAAMREPPERQRAQLSTVFRTLLPDATEVLERRRLAGTLLHGKCAPHEMLWTRQFVSEDSPEMPSKVVEASALLMGYEVYLKAAYLALAWLCESEELAPTAEQRPKVFSFVISAVDLMCLPRPIKDVILHGEATLLARVREA